MKRQRITAVIFALIFGLLSSPVGLAETYVLPSLSEIYQDYFLIGGAVSVASWAPKTLISHGDLFKSQLNSLTAENAMKPDYLQPREGVFNFREPDNLIRFAEDNGMVVRGHTLVWHAQTPDWFFTDLDGNLIYEKDEVTEAERQLVIDRMEAHIEKVMNHFGDTVYAWDVVNEAVSDDMAHIHRPDSPWVRTLGDDFIKIAFRKAREVNPDIKLFYNDYNPEMVYKRGRTISMLRDMINDGVPIDGIGIQGHWDVGGTSIKEIEDALKMYIDLGLEIEITEMDVGIGDHTEEEQAERYRQLFELFKKYSDHITNVTLWGIADDASWRGDDDPLLFNRDHEPKPAFWALVDTDKPWYVNKAEHEGAVAFKDSNSRIVGVLRPGEYLLDDLGFNLLEIAELEVARRYLVTFYESEDLSGDTWHFIGTNDLSGSDIASKASYVTITFLEDKNIALNKPVEASALSDRAVRVVDGNYGNSWSPRETAPYWVVVDLEEPYMLNRWIVRWHGTGPLAGLNESPFNAADFKLQVSDDGDNWIDVDVVEGNTASITDRDLNLVTGRYVRLYVTRPTSLDVNQNLVVYQMELFGMPIN